MRKAIKILLTVILAFVFTQSEAQFIYHQRVPQWFDDLKVDSILLLPKADTADYPASDYFRDVILQASDKKIYYSDSSSWKVFGGTTDSSLFTTISRLKDSLEAVRADFPAPVDLSDYYKKDSVKIVVSDSLEKAVLLKDSTIKYVTPTQLNDTSKKVAFKNVAVKDSIWLNGKWVKGFSNDSTMGSGADNVIPTQGAVKKAINSSKVFINVKDFGAVGDDSTDNTNAIQNALNSIPAAGGTLFFPAGNYIVNGDLTLNKNTRLLGGSGLYSINLTDSQFVSAGAVLIHNSKIDTFFTISTQGAQIENIAFVNAADTATSGIGLYMTNAGTFNMSNCVIKGFYNNMLINNGVGWTINSCLFVNPINYNLRIYNIIRQDEGDHSISGCSFLTNNNSATDLLWNSSGGFKMTNCKFHPYLGNSTRFNTALDFHATGTGSSDIQITNTSIEGFSGYGIRFHRDSGAALQNILISNCQIYPIATLSGNAIRADSVNFGSISGCIIKDNESNSNAAVYLNDCNSWNIYPVIFTGWSTPVFVVNSSNINYRPVMEESLFSTGSIPFSNISGQLTQDNSNLFWNQNNQRLGVGIKIPRSRLHVNGSITLGDESQSNSVGFINGNNATKGYGGAIKFSTSNTTSQSYLEFGIKNAAGAFLDYIKMTYDGYVGILNSNPAYPLDVDGSINGITEAASDSSTKMASTGFVKQIFSQRIYNSESVSGDGSTTNFTVSISPGFTPSKIIITPTSDDAAKAQFYVDKTSITGTQFTIKAAGTTPPSGTDNITFDYELIK